MITPDMKIYNIVKQYPELMDVLIEQSPKFIKLRNKVVFNTMAKITNVYDAAKIGSLETEDLLLALNKAIGKDQEFLSQKAENKLVVEDKLSFNESSNSVDWQDMIDSFAIIDARELGDDAFSKIMDLAKTINNGEGFCAIQKFEPVPLYNALERRGFEHFTSKISEEEYRAYFYKK